MCWFDSSLHITRMLCNALNISCVEVPRRVQLDQHRTDWRTSICAEAMEVDVSLLILSLCESRQCLLCRNQMVKGSPTCGVCHLKHESQAMDKWNTSSVIPTHPCEHNYVVNISWMRASSSTWSDFWIQMTPLFCLLVWFDAIPFSTSQFECHIAAQKQACHPWLGFSTGWFPTSEIGNAANSESFNPIGTKKLPHFTGRYSDSELSYTVQLALLMPFVFNLDENLKLYRRPNCTAPESPHWQRYSWVFLFSSHRHSSSARPFGLHSDWDEEDVCERNIGCEKGVFSSISLFRALELASHTSPAAFWHWTTQSCNIATQCPSANGLLEAIVALSLALRLRNNCQCE
jgi:hypothetical protein